MALEVLARKFAVWEYTAVMVCDPTSRGSDVVHVATPELNGRELQRGRLVPPSLNATFPVGVPDPGRFAVTVAVNVTARPNMLGLCDVATTVVVAALLTS